MYPLWPPRTSNVSFRRSYRTNIAKVMKKTIGGHGCLRFGSCCPKAQGPLFAAGNSLKDSAGGSGSDPIHSIPAPQDHATYDLPFRCEAWPDGKKGISTILRNPALQPFTLHCPCVMTSLRVPSLLSLRHRRGSALSMKAMVPLGTAAPFR